VNLKHRVTFFFVYFLATIVLFPQITLINPNGGEIWQTGKSPKIIWKSQGINKVNVSYSTDAGISWLTIAKDLPATLLYYRWIIPGSVSNKCLLKIVSAENDSVADVSDSLFTIKENDGSVIKFVVLGSSTAAGTGPSPIDSAWVWRYREYLFQRNTATQLINLAVGGYTTYHIMPDEFVPPSGRPPRVIGRNISSALLASPNAIIINMPSNDAANNYPVSEQVSNYKIIMAKANAKNIPVWVATPQPRNFSQSQINLQLAMVDSTYKLFGDHAIDFWTDIAAPDARINPLYNSGDGIHLNNAGHRVLFSRVVDEKILEQLKIVSDVAKTQVLVSNFTLEQNYPNPFNPETKIRFSLSEPRYTTLKIFDVLGNEIITLVDGVETQGIHEVIFNTNLNAKNRHLNSGVYFYQLSSESSIQTRKMLLLQ